jgi:AcrR family transcriptional regulator
MSNPSALRTASPASTRAPARRRSQAERREAARERILDAAEELFGVGGFYGVTLRDVAMQAGADTALLHYYFRGKAELFNSVLARRAELVNRTRMESLEAYERSHGERMTPHGVVSAYLKPTLELITRGGPGMRHYGRVVAKVNSTGVTDDFDVSVTPFDPVVHKLVSMLKRIRPDCREEDLYWFYHMLSGAISLSFAETGRIDTLSNGRCKSADLDTIFDRMASIFGAGLEGLGGQQRPTKPQRKRPRARAKRK